MFVYNFSGKQKSLEWMTSFVLSAIESILCVQPVKIIVTAMIIALIVKTIEWGDSKEIPDPFLDEEIFKIKEQAYEIGFPLSGKSKL